MSYFIFYEKMFGMFLEGCVDTEVFIAVRSRVAEGQTGIRCWVWRSSEFIKHLWHKKTSRC